METTTREFLTKETSRERIQGKLLRVMYGIPSGLRPRVVFNSAFSFKEGGKK